MLVKKLVATIIAITLPLAACSPALSTADAEATVVKFHEQFDASSFAEVYDNSAPELKDAASKENFVSFMTIVRAKLGTFQSTKQAGWHVSDSKTGDFIDLTYNTTFEHGQGVESFRFRTDHGPPRLVGYKIDSPALITDGTTANSSRTSSNAILAS